SGTISSVNPIAEQLLGQRADHLIGLAIEKVFSLRLGEQGEHVPNLVMTAIEQGRVIQSSENAIVETQQGENLPVICSAAPIRDSAQNIIGCVLVFRDVSEARRVARRLNWQSSHDSLTNLPNRHYFEDELSHLVRNAKQMESQHVLLFLDLDQFKVVNDSCGHVAGDELLRQLGQRLQEHVRRGDVVARLGGDEFGVILPNCPTEAGEKVADTLRKVIMDFRFSWRGATFSVGVSIGIVPITSATESASSALTVADAACYSAKDSGRNQIHVYEPDDSEYQKRHGQMQWVTRIQEAIAEDRFCLFCQPIVPVNSIDKKPSHYEILIRMIDHDGKLITPAAFIPVAERFRLMMDIDRWVVTHALNKISEIDLGEDIKVFYAINLSGVSLGNAEFLNFVQDQITRSKVRPEQICFEITETAAISNISRAIELISTLKNMGCYFALDDFGSGLSSFAYLKELPVDFLKIDGEFVRDMDKNSVDEAMVSAINHLGHVMGIKTVAEFVENDAIMQKLREIGVDYAQGYGIAKPYLIDDLKLIKRTA
ncbi:MAG TPA: EAL domain-containing protein, partial [Pseudomonadales bacterium]|nr:EAL domain-containing protein [Pseudomonadales bacterium]